MTASGNWLQRGCRTGNVLSQRDYYHAVMVAPVDCP